LPWIYVAPYYMKNANVRIANTRGRATQGWDNYTTNLAL
jgi:hypothetical protein